MSEKHELPDEIQVLIAAICGVLTFIAGYTVLTAMGVEPVRPLVPKTYGEVVGRDLSKKPENQLIWDYMRGEDE